MRSKYQAGDGIWRMLATSGTYSEIYRQRCKSYMPLSAALLDERRRPNSQTPEFLGRCENSSRIFGRRSSSARQLL